MVRRLCGNVQERRAPTARGTAFSKYIRILSQPTTPSSALLELYRTWATWRGCRTPSLGGACPNMAASGGCRAEAAVARSGLDALLVLVAAAAAEEVHPVDVNDDEGDVGDGKAAREDGGQAGRRTEEAREHLPDGASDQL